MRCCCVPSVQADLKDSRRSGDEPNREAWKEDSCAKNTVQDSVLPDL